MNKDFLFEIGTEEIPSKYMPKTLEAAKTIMEQKLKDNRIGYNEIMTYGTPRRIVILVSQISLSQEDLSELVKGPAKKAAFDSEGNSTKALQGFLRGQKANLEDIIIKELSGCEYIYVMRKESGKPTKEVLKGILPEVITSFTFPKSMKWGNKSFRFARPIRWVMPILGDELIEFNKDNILCTRMTKGHRVLCKDDIEINNTSEYFEKLKCGYVIVDQNERRDLIKSQADVLSKKVGGNVIVDEELLEEIVYLVEYPTALIGNFEEKYLKLPKEAVITPMKEHQRYFPVEDNQGKLMNYFIAVRNGDDKYLDIVAQGNEKVLRARLSDAEFFFNEDKKHKLDANVEKLKHVVFQETLGTIYEKSERIQKICAYIAKKLNLSNQNIMILERAAFLCKADLVTNMVKEFDELQGLMGREYALLQNEKKEVADAIYEHYLPRNASDSTPDTIIGSILAIADRIDTICGCFAIGIQPTGSQDPYALRRQAIGIISIIKDKKFEIDLPELINNVMVAFEIKGIIKSDINIIKNDILEFFKGRLKNVLVENGYEYDIIDAVFGSNFVSIVNLGLKVQVISSWKKKEEFLNIISSFNRVTNLASKANNTDINSELFEENEEKKLYDSYKSTKSEYNTALDSKDYDSAMKLLINLKNPIDDFFEKIMVMVEDQRIRENRLAILKSISNMMNELADLSKIVVK